MSLLLTTWPVPTVLAASNADKLGAGSSCMITRPANARTPARVPVAISVACTGTPKAASTSSAGGRRHRPRLLL